MQIFQSQLVDGHWNPPLADSLPAQLVLLFGGPLPVNNDEFWTDLERNYPLADVVGCTSSGVIHGNHIHDDRLCLTAIAFERSAVKVVGANYNNDCMDQFVGSLLAQLPSSDEDNRALTSVLVIAEGININGSVLTDSLNRLLPTGVSVSGGLAGDKANFEETFVWHNRSISNTMVVMCGLYGAHLKVAHASGGGWQPFGPERQVTQAEGNVLWQLDGAPALDLYRRYLGDEAKSLPASALLYPLLIKPAGRQQVIRTVLNIDQDKGAMIFAGDIPERSTVVLMRANYDGLVDGARECASRVRDSLPIDTPGLGFMVSCVGRRLVLGRRSDEEVEAVCEVFGSDWRYTGFYSNGEICPIENDGCCEFHNETMTLTFITEAL